MSGMIHGWKDKTPNIHPTAFVHPDATVIGDVTLAAGVNIWPGAVLRGDQGAITIGEDTNIQDGCVLHATGGVSTVRVGARCTVGHRAVLHGCDVGDDVLVGMGSVLLDNCVLRGHTIVGAGSLVTVGKVFEPGWLIVGSPAKAVRKLNDKDVDFVDHGHHTYRRLADEYAAAGLGGRR